TTELVASCVSSLPSSFFLCTDTSTTEIYTLSLHDALPIFTILTPDEGRKVAPGALSCGKDARRVDAEVVDDRIIERSKRGYVVRSEEHTSELQSRENLVCRLLLEKKKKKIKQKNGTEIRTA